MLSDLITDIEAHLAWRNGRGYELAETTFGMKAVKDSKLVRRLRGGSGLTVSKMQQIRDWIAADRAAVESLPPRAPKQDAA